MPTDDQLSHLDLEKPSSGLVTGTRPSLGRYIRDTWDRRRLVKVLAVRSLKGMYEMNVVGFAWWILEPLSMSLMYYFVFTHIFHRSRPVASLLAAVLPYKWLSQSLVQAMGTVRGNASLLDVYFPRSLLPAADTLVGLAHFAVGLFVLPPFMAIYGHWGGAHLVWLPLIMCVQLVFTLGLAFPLSVWGISYRNLPGVVNNLLRLWFYLSPGIWTLEFIDDRSQLFKNIVRANPLTGLFEAYRGALIEGRPPGIEFAWTATVAAVLFVTSFWYFSRREPNFAKLI